MKLFSILITVSILFFGCTSIDVKIHCHESLVEVENKSIEFDLLNLKFAKPQDWYVYTCDEKAEWYSINMEKDTSFKNENLPHHILFMRKYDKELMLDEYLTINRVNGTVVTEADKNSIIERHFNREYEAKRHSISLDNFQRDTIFCNQNKLFYFSSQSVDPYMDKVKTTKSYLFFKDEYAYKLSIIYTDINKVNWILSEIKNNC